MNGILPHSAEQFVQDHRRKKLWQQVVTGMACIVVFCTVYALILPAITLEKVDCEIPEHEHTLGCYTQIPTLEETVPVCTPESLAIHEHTIDCYDPAGNLICGQADFVLHRHTDECYTEDGELWCTLPEITVSDLDPDLYTDTPWDSPDETGDDELSADEKHIHTAACYEKMYDILVCDLDEDGHQHTEDCYDADGALVCGEEERQGHIHTEDCYLWDEVLTCSLTGDEAEEPEFEAEPEENSSGHAVDGVTLHRHTAACSSADGQLVCGKLEVYEHQHTEDCFELQEVPVDPDELTCTLEEDGTHTHGPLCYGQWELTCTLEEHIHGTDCEAPDEEMDADADETDPDDPDSAGDADETGPDETDPDQAQDQDGAPEDTGRETVYLCGLKEHLHDDYCYNTSGELTCTLEEHTHSAGCVPLEGEPSEEEVLTGFDRVDQVTALIDALPTLEEAEATLTAYEDAGDWEGYEAYYTTLSRQTMEAHLFYEDIGSELQPLVFNSDRLLAFEWLYSAQTLEISNSLTIYNVNCFSQINTTLAFSGTSNKTVKDCISSGGWAFTTWTAIIVKKQGNAFIVDSINSSSDAKSSLVVPQDGFIIIVHPNSSSIVASQGDTISIDGFDYTSSLSNANGLGTVTFSSPTTVSPKPEKDNTSKLDTIPSANTRDLIEVNLYDYGANINDLYNQDRRYPGFQQDNGSINVGNAFSQWSSFNFGNNITADLAAGKSGVTSGTGINTVDAANRANRPITGAIQSSLGADGYPALMDGGFSLGYLFSDGVYAHKQNRQSINGLFQHNPITGAYTFNSRENHAQFNSDDDTFTLYRQLITSNFMMYPFGNFLPFNDIVHTCAQTSTIDKAYLQSIANSAQYKYDTGNGDAYGTLATQLNQFIGLMDNAYPNGWDGVDCMNEYFKAADIPRTFSKDTDSELIQNLYSIDYDEPTDFYFGMEMKMNFMQPKGGLTGNDTNNDGVSDYPMVFYFTGDDDVWVYIDNTLFLDLSGIHRHVGGEIDFQRGEVRYYDLDVSIGDVGNTPYKTVSFRELVDPSLLNENGSFKDYSTHSFNFYYMERGSGSGVCRMNFNFPLLKKNTISVTKELSVDEPDKLEILGDPDFYFQILKENSTDPFIGENISYDILDASGTKVDTKATGENGVFTLKASQTAVFSDIPENSGRYYVRELLDPQNFEQYGTISVDGTSQTTLQDVIVGGDSFKGVDSPVKDMSSGSTSFHFNNQVTWNKLGSLSIEKTLTEYPKSRTALQFEFEVTLDGIPLPTGTEYTVDGASRTVQQAGILVLAPGEKAVIPGILAGSNFAVKETEDSASGYTVNYMLDNEPVTSLTGGGYVTGTIFVNHTVSISVNNSEQGTSVTIPVQKTLNAPDGLQHTYTVRLEQVTDSTGSVLTDPKFVREMPLSIENDPVSGQFELGYAQAGLDTLPQCFYYKITEPTDEAQTDTLFDSSVYIVEVTVAKTDSTLSASVTGIWKDGTPQSFEETDVPMLSFTNTILRYELPNTGGAGTLPYTMGGVLLLTGAALLLLYHHTKRRKEDIVSS